MARSDIWRNRKHEDLAREIAYITNGIESYIGSAAHDRDYRVSWTPIPGTIGATIPKQKRVLLCPSLINNMPAPLTGEQVDRIVQVSAHEAGHATLSNGKWYNPNTRTSNRLVNIVEDMLIDGPAYGRYNRGLGALTATLRAGFKNGDTRSILASWRGTEQLDACRILDLWGLGALYGVTLPDVPHRQTELATVRQLDAVTPDILGKNVKLSLRKRDALLAQVWSIMYQYQTPPPIAPPTPPQGPQCGPNVPADGPPQDGQPDTPPNGGTGSDPQDAPQEPQDAGDDEPPAKSPVGGSKTETRPQDETPQEPEIAPLHGCPSNPPEVADTNRAFWQDVAGELAALTLEGGSGIGKLDNIIDPVIVAQVRRALDDLADEPDLSRRHDAGRFDRRRIVEAAHGRTDTFTRRDERQIEGQIVLAIDMSGSTNPENRLIHSAAASIYKALEGSDVACSIYAYGGGTVKALASPTEVFAGLGTMKSHGGTPSAEAVQTVTQNCPTVTGMNVLIHVTDGCPNDRTTLQQAVDEAIALGWQVLNVYVSSYEGYHPDNPIGSIGVTLTQYSDLGNVIADAVRSLNP